MSEKQNTPKIQICLGIHNHQPSGNFDSVVADAVKRCYKPFIEAISEYPKVKWAVHFSGPLLLWLSERERGLLDTVKALVERGQLEILGSGIGEAILCTLPPRDVEKQIREMNELMNHTFNCKVRGIWLTERIWEPVLPAVLAPLGVEYVLVDDYHFFYAGFKRGTLDGYYSVEKHGHVLKVFPISEALRYRIPFKPVPELIPELKQWAQASAGRDKPMALTYVDDGEKFGLWPGTFDWVYEKRWLHLFLQALEENSDWLETKLLSEVADERIATGRAALPTASYHEMMEWALPVEAGRAEEALSKRLNDEERTMLRGGFWDQFFVKYEESCRMHRRMLWVSERLHELEVKNEFNEKALTKLGRARSILHQAQCNDAFWHGLFGGLYLPFLRSAVYKRLIEAENVLDSVEPKYGMWETDFDRDGNPEVVLKNKEQMLAISGRHGAGIYLWDDLAKGHSMSDVLTRREEAYHNKVRTAGSEDNQGAPKSIHEIVATKEANLSRYLVYDKGLRISGKMAFYRGDITAEGLRYGMAQEAANLGETNFKLIERGENPNGWRVDYKVENIGLGSATTAIEKEYFVSKEYGGFELHVSLFDLKGDIAGLKAGIEFNLTLDALDSARFIEVTDERIELNSEKSCYNVNKLRIVDLARGLEFVISTPFKVDAMIYPIETISVSESGFERNYQGTCIHLSTPVEQIVANKNLRLKVERRDLRNAR